MSARVKPKTASGLMLLYEDAERWRASKWAFEVMRDALRGEHCPAPPCSNNHERCNKRRAALALADSIERGKA